MSSSVFVSLGELAMSDATEREIHKNDDYWIALGQFVQTYSAAEAIVQVLLQERANVTSETARAIFSGVRIKEAMSYIKRISQAQGITEPDMLEPAFAQLADITSARNDILHYGAKFEDGKPEYVTTKRSAHLPEKARHFPVSPKILRQMIADIAVIMIQIELAWNYGAYQSEADRREFTQAFPQPWQYKHAPQAGNREKPRGPDQGQPNPPQASGG